MKTLNNGLQVEILKTFRNASNNYKDDKRTEYADLLKVRFASGEIKVICSTELNK